MTLRCEKCGRELREGEVCTCGLAAVPADPTAKTGLTADETEKASVKSVFGTVSGALKEAWGWVRGTAEKAKPVVSRLYNRLMILRVRAKNRMGIGSPESNAFGVYERNLQIVPECIDTNENEVPVKQYNIAILRSRLKFMRAEGRLQVTNKRVIFRATGRSIAGKTVQQQEFALDHLKGIEVRQDYRFSIGNWLLAAMVLSPVAWLATVLIGSVTGLKLLTGLIVYTVGLLSMVPFFLMHKKWWFKWMTTALATTLFVNYWQLLLRINGGATFFSTLSLIFAICAVIPTIVCWFMVCWLPNLVITVKTDGSGTQNGAVLIRRKPSFWEFFFHRATGAEEYSGFAQVMPWVDTGVATDELGALIDDLQKLGDMGVEKWKVPEEAPCP